MTHDLDLPMANYSDTQLSTHYNTTTTTSPS